MSISRLHPIPEHADLVDAPRHQHARNRGEANLSARTRVPSLMRGVREAGGALPSTHSSSATNSARRAGVGLCGLRGLTHGAAWSTHPRGAAVLRAGDQVAARVRRAARRRAAERIGDEQRRALLPVLGRRVGLHPQRIEAVVAQHAAGPRRSPGRSCARWRTETRSPGTCGLRAGCGCAPAARTPRSGTRRRRPRCGRGRRRTPCARSRPG